MKTYLYIFKAFESTFEVEAKDIESAKRKICKLWGIRNFPYTATIVEK